MSSAGAAASISPAEWSFASTQRSRVYEGFAALFATGVSEKSFAEFFARGRFAPFLGLEELGLEQELQRLDAAIEALRREPLARLELAADFAQLFLLDERTGALPYASAYLGEGGAALLYGATEAWMREMLSSRALSVSAEFREPADHLAVLLSLLARVAGEGASACDMALAAREQLTLLQSGLLEWLPRFVERCQQAKTSFDVYPALASLLLGFVQADRLFLGDIAGD